MLKPQMRPKAHIGRKSEESELDLAFFAAHFVKFALLKPPTRMYFCLQRKARLLPTHSKGQDMKSQALILIDIQIGFGDPSWGKRNNDSFETNISNVLETWRGLGLPVIHVRHNSENPDSPLRPGQLGNEFMEISQPRTGEKIIEKIVNSAFIGTDLEKNLNAMAIDNLILAGLSTDHCVSTTTRMAANLGFKCVVLADATATFPRLDCNGTCLEAKLVHRVSLASLDGEFATVITTSEFIASLEDL